MTTTHSPAIPTDDVLSGDIVDPVARAESRFSALQHRFADILAILAAMYSDEDWRYLTKNDGTPYSGFSELVATALSCSASYARRYTQGLNSLYLPLQEIVVEGTAIEITSSDVAILGSGGAREVIEAVEARVTEVDSTPAAHAEVVSEVIDEVKAEQQRQKTRPSAADDDPTAASAFADGERDPRGSDAPPWDVTDTETSPDESEADELLNAPRQPRDGSPKETGSRKGGSPSPTFSDDDTEYVPANRTAVAEPLDLALDGCTPYDCDDAIASLPNDDLRNFRAALNALSGLDAETIAAAITSDTRGVLLGSDHAATLITDVRNRVRTTADWVAK